MSREREREPRVRAPCLLNEKERASGAGSCMSRERESLGCKLHVCRGREREPRVRAYVCRGRERERASGASSMSVEGGRALGGTSVSLTDTECDGLAVVQDHIVHF